MDKNSQFKFIKVKAFSVSPYYHHLTVSNKKLSILKHIKAHLSSSKFLNSYAIRNLVIPNEKEGITTWGFISKQNTLKLVKVQTGKSKVELKLPTTFISLIFFEFTLYKIIICCLASDGILS